MTNTTHRDITHKLKLKVIPTLTSAFLNNIQTTHFGLLRDHHQISNNKV